MEKTLVKGAVGKGHIYARAGSERMRCGAMFLYTSEQELPPGFSLEPSPGAGGRARLVWDVAAWTRPEMGAEARGGWSDGLEVRERTLSIDDADARIVTTCDVDILVRGGNGRVSVWISVDGPGAGGLAMDGAFGPNTAGRRNGRLLFPQERNSPVGDLVTISCRC